MSRIFAMAVNECTPRSTGKNATVSNSKRYGQVTRKKFAIIKSDDQATRKSLKLSNT